MPTTTLPWTRERQRETLKRGPHKLAHEYAEFLSKEMLKFVNKGQWVVLPHSLIESIPELATQV